MGSSPNYYNGKLIGTFSNANSTAFKYDIKYSISGPGVDQPPLNYFYIERETGNLFVTCPIDREMYPEFKFSKRDELTCTTWLLDFKVIPNPAVQYLLELKTCLLLLAMDNVTIICYAVTPEGYTPETPLVHVIKIEDDNDNAPEFEHDPYIFGVVENSRVGTLVGQVTATDRDEPNTLHSTIRYRIVSQSGQMYHISEAFGIHPDSGSITVLSPNLDRETTLEYRLEVEARDMGGYEFALCTTAEVIIEIRDINDNVPRLEQTMYEVDVFENTENVEILLIPIKDDDQVGTPSWLGTATIIRGNEDHSFSITVDEDTNVGHLTALKVTIDQIDNISYRIINGMCNWIIIDNTGQLRTTRVLDRDTPNMEYSPCTITVCATDR
ncbi:UNVERIFIED_CONTAM: hypothetical protein K2H54_047810, partial [Gekko kuhli]